MEAAEFATLVWVDRYNIHRLLERIGNLPPAEAEACYYAQFEAPTVAALIKPAGSVARIADGHE